MKHCNSCKIDVDTDANFCPLCYADLSEVNQNESETFFSHQTSKKNAKKSYKSIKILIFLSILAITTCFFINIKNGGPLWSVIILLSIGYVWVLVMHTILSHDTPFRKVFVQVVWIVCFLLVVNRFYVDFDWFTYYAFPGVCLLALIIMLFFAGCSKNRDNIILSFFEIFVLMIIASSLLIIFKIDKFKTLNQINIIVQALACFSFILFAWKPLKNEAMKKFHI